MGKNRGRKRRFIPDECNHIYQRTTGGKILFYDREDFLICYMIISVTARKYSIRVLELCMMVDHIHMLIEAESRYPFSFIRAQTFSRRRMLDIPL